MKKIQFPEVRCIELNSHDVILTSGDQGGTYDPDAAPSRSSGNGNNIW